MRPVAKVLSVAVGLLAVLATTGAALAHDDDDDGWKHWRHRRGPVYFVPPGYYYAAPRPYVYVPPPRVYYPEPQYYSYGPPPPAGLNINIPLR